MKGYFARVEPQAKKRIHYMLYFTLRDQRDVQRELGLPIKLPSIGLCGSGRLSHTDQMMSAFSKRPWLLWIPSVKSGAHCFRLVFFSHLDCNSSFILWYPPVGSPIFHTAQQSHTKCGIVCGCLGELQSDKVICCYFSGQKYTILCFYGDQKVRPRKSTQTLKGTWCLYFRIFFWRCISW